MAGPFYDVMVDIETTGTDPGASAIIQLAAVKFNLETKEVDSSSMFNRCLNIPPKRYWDESTRAWWGQQKRAILEDIFSRTEDPKTVLQAFSEWAVGDGLNEPLRFWAKPTHFDYAFLQNYCNQFDVHLPFHYRYAVDMNSFIRGLARNSKTEGFKVPFVGDAHNALMDVINQISTVFGAMEHYDAAATQA